MLYLIYSTIPVRYCTRTLCIMARPSFWTRTRVPEPRRLLSILNTVVKCICADLHNLLFLLRENRSLSNIGTCAQCEHAIGGEKFAVDGYSGNLLHYICPQKYANIGIAIEEVHSAPSSRRAAPHANEVLSKQRLRRRALHLCSDESRLQHSTAAFRFLQSAIHPFPSQKTLSAVLIS